jgi:hypothetical protein
MSRSIAVRCACSVLALGVSSNGSPAELTKGQQQQFGQSANTDVIEPTALPRA